MPYQVCIEKEETAASTDVFSGTDLDAPIADGIAQIWACSTVNTATLDVPQMGHRAGITQLLRKRTDGIPNLSDDPAFIIPIKKGVKPIVVLGGTTGTVHFTALVTYKGG